MTNIKLKKCELKEGITLELIERADFCRKCNPVIFQKGDEPVEILKCSTGYWIKMPEGYLKDEKGKLIVFSERDCIVARARYLLHHADEEKQLEAEKLLQCQRKKIQEKLEIFRRNIDDIINYSEGGSISQIITSAAESLMSEEEQAVIKKINEEKAKSAPQLEKQYSHLVSEFEKENYNYLLDVMGIESVPNPIIFHYENKDEMRALKNAFGGDAIDFYNGDVNAMFSRLAIEKKYKL